MTRITGETTKKNHSLRPTFVVPPRLQYRQQTVDELAGDDYAFIVRRPPPTSFPFDLAPRPFAAGPTAWHNAWGLVRSTAKNEAGDEVALLFFSLGPSTCHFAAFLRVCTNLIRVHLRWRRSF
jgi:hypothetical protein